MFPEGLCDSLETLQSRAPTHSYAFSRKQVEAALEMPLEDAFERFEETPVASGSIAQVHRAVLRRKKHQTTQGGSTMASLPQGLSSGLLSAGGGDAGSRMNGGDGQLVAVKVRHPGVAKRMRIDFALMKVVGQVSTALWPTRIRFPASLTQYYATSRLSTVYLGWDGHNWDPPWSSSATPWGKPGSAPRASIASTI
eukprot:scaffold340_cov256-Pinguiococcus_pyrenoidosus.AAC.3